jgi:putative IMPACT (imprinted ancient) family translation regulator
LIITLLFFIHNKIVANNTKIIYNNAGLVIDMKQILDDKIYQIEIVVKKSRFITYVKKITTQFELEEFKNECFKKDARHNCFAYRYKMNDIPTQGYENDGEPTGTSGDVLLRFIEFNKLDNVIIYVVRYFGGTKLGTGLLARTYVSGAKELVNNVITFETKKQFQKNIKVKIQNQKPVISFLNKLDCEVNSQFSENEIQFTIESDFEIDLDEIKHLLI